MKTITSEISEGNKLIAEFIGYRLAPCRNGLAWVSPYVRASDDRLELHGRLWQKNDSYYKWHCSWDWIMPIVDIIEERGYLFFISNLKIEYARKSEYPNKTQNLFVPGGKLIATWTAVLMFIKEYNENHQKSTKV